jgi:hypothetical protein
VLKNLRCPDRRPAGVPSLLICATALFCLTLLYQPELGAEENGERGDRLFYGIADMRRYFAWGWNLIPTGIDLTIGWTLQPWLAGVDTILQATVGGGYEGFATFRTPDYIPNQPLVPPEAAADPSGSLEFNSPNFQWQAGIRQGILWNTAEDRNLLELFLYYRGRYDRYLDGRHYWGSSDSEIAAIEASHEAWQETFIGSDAHGIFGTSLFTGLTYDARHFDRRSKAYDGVYAEGSVELSPYFPSVLGASDFWRLNFTAKFFKTLYEARPDTEKNWFTIYAGSCLAVDYADARRQMPLYVMQTLGGSVLREGLAGAVRGFEDSSWDTQLKIVHNLDLRFNLPVIYSIRGRDFVPGMVLYFDLGYGTRYWSDPANTEGGFLGSTGAGIFIGILDFVYTHLYFQVPLIGRRIDGAPFAVDLDLGMHF